MYFHITQMVPCNGFPNRLCHLVRTFTVKFVMTKSRLLFTKFVGKDTTRRKLVVDRLSEDGNKGKVDTTNTPKYTVLSMVGLTSPVWTLVMFQMVDGES